MEEIWKDIKGYEGFYQVSNFGNIRSLDRFVYYRNGRKTFIQGKPIKTHVSKDGCARINLSKNGTRITYLLARIVYSAFNLNFDYNDSTLKIYHKNEDQSKNNIENLYVVIVKEIPKIFNNFFYIKGEDKPVICVTTNKKFNSIFEAGEFYKIHYTGISKCCHSLQKYAGKIILDDGTVYKLVWKFIE